MLESLAQEVADFEIKVTLIEPGPFATDFVSGSSMRQTRPIAAYDEIREKLLAAFTPDVFGDPQSTLGAVFKIVDADKPPFHGDKLPELARLQTVQEFAKRNVAPFATVT